ncbi:MAG: twin-arginine translocase subunit TatC [Solirubrobacteraceae bacterium]
MATRLKPIRHDQRLSLVEHLDELRTRIIICALTLAVVGGVCFWQADYLLNTVNDPLTETANKRSCGETTDPLELSACWQQAQKRLNERIAATADALARFVATDEPALRAQAEQLSRAAAAAADATPRGSPRRPVTLGVGEPFTATLTVAAYGALLLSLPLLLYQLYAFVLPAFSPTERRVALPLMTMVPFLFYAGVVFSYYLLLPAAVNFLQNFNDDNFDILIQARDYYKFAVMLLAAMGVLFQLPVVILAVTRMGILSIAQLRKGRRYAIVVIAVVAMLLPGTDPVTMISMMLPMVFLYEGSILLVSLLERRAERARAREEAAEAAATGSELAPPDPDDD